MKQSFIFSISIFAFLAMVSCQSPASEQSRGVELLPPTAFMEAYESEADAVLIDCRTPGEVSRGKVAGAVNIDFRSTSFLTEAEKIDKSKPVYIYCQAGGRSAAAAEKLKGLGFEEVHDMEGGYSAYSKQ